MSAVYVDDVLLVDRCLTGEAAATRELFRRHRQRVHATLYRVLGHNGEMEDLLQETFLQVFRGLGSWRADASLATWIDRIAVRVAYRAIRNRKRIAVPIGDGHGPGSPPLDDDRAPMGLLRSVPASGAAALGARRAIARLLDVLATLPAGPRVAFALFVLDGRSLAETAQLTEATVTATKLRIWRARRAVEAAARQHPELHSYLAEAA